MKHITLKNNRVLIIPTLQIDLRLWFKIVLSNINAIFTQAAKRVNL